ncbi:MAG: C40 family peptidase, partial [Gemmatimonadota bacterium]
GSGSPASPAAAAALRSTVVTTARQALGTPYRWGGSDENGFDCSGLIQHAYAQAGIALPRRSVDQARAGVPVERRVDLLAPGDILTFSEAGGQVSHVGLYLGDGAFIHSASKGIVVSAISSTEPEARWWITRWVGARRIISSP